MRLTFLSKGLRAEWVCSKYKVWALKDYKMLYEIDGSRLRPLYGGETKISPGVMLLGFEPSETELLCRVLDIETGEVGSAWPQQQV